MDKKEILKQLKELKKNNPNLKYHHKNKIEVLQQILNDELERLHTEANDVETVELIEEPAPKAGVPDKGAENKDCIKQLANTTYALTQLKKKYESLFQEYEVMVASNAKLQAQLQETGTNKPEYTIPEFKAKLNEFREYSVELTKQIRGKCPNSFISILNNYIRRDLEIATKKLFKRYS